MDKIHTVCFTGHRPEKLPDMGDCGSPVISAIKSMLYSEISDAVSEGFTSFMTGMARGIDLWAGEAVADMILSGSNLHIIPVFPHKGYEKRYSADDRTIADKILSLSEDAVYLAEHYYKGCMAVRNRYLVDHSSELIAVVSDYKSGTGQTIRYASSAGLKKRIIDLNELFPREGTQLKFM